MPDGRRHIEQIVASQRAARESRALLEQADDLYRSSCRLIQSTRMQVEASRRAMEAATRLRNTVATERSDQDG